MEKEKQRFTNWAEEYRKCKISEAYFFENYCLINGKRPGTYTVKRFKDYKDSIQSARAVLRRRGIYNIAPFLLARVEHPLTPEEVFLQLNLLEDGNKDR